MRKSAIAGALLLAMTGTGIAQAQSIDDLRRQMQLIQRRINQLEADQRRAEQGRVEAEATARRAQQEAEAANARAARAEATVTARPVAAAGAQPAAESAPTPSSIPGGFRIPGTDTSVRLYGFAKLSMMGDLGPRNRSDVLTAQSIPLSHGAGGAVSPGEFQATARRSRLGIETRTQTGSWVGDIHTLVEIDFAGQTNDLTTQATSSSYTPRLRKAYAEFGQIDRWGSILIGQNDSLWNDAGLLPFQWLGDWTYLGTSAVRQAQLRYSNRFSPGWTAAFAIENSYSDVTTASGVSYPDANGGAGFAMSRTPDFTARLMAQGEWGLAALRAVLRPEININNQGAAAAGDRYSRSTTGWGIGFTGALNLLDKRLVLSTALTYGDGIGRYLDSTSAGLGAISSAGQVPAGQARVDTVRVATAMLGATWFFTPSLRANVSGAIAELDYPSYVANFVAAGGCLPGGVGGDTGSATCGALNRRIYAGSAALIWSPWRSIDVGIEYQHVERMLVGRNADGTRGGKADRFQGSVIVRF